MRPATNEQRNAEIFHSPSLAQEFIKISQLGKTGRAAEELWLIIPACIACNLLKPFPIDP